MSRFQNILRSKKTKHGKLDMKDMTFSILNKRYDNLVFLTKVYAPEGIKSKKRILLGFATHSPCGNVRDQEQEWYVIDYETLDILDECYSRAMGKATGEFTGWYKELKNQYGKAQYLLNKFGEREWKITEA